MNNSQILIVLTILLLGFFSYDGRITGKAVSEISTYHSQFTAWKDTGTSSNQGARGEGSIVIPLSEPADYCEIQGTWKTNNRILAVLGRPQKHCHKFTGTFTATVSKDGRQSGTTDAHLRKWAGPSNIPFDPEPQTFDDRIFEINTCGHLYYSKTFGGSTRNHITGHARLEDKELTLIWEYMDNEWKPAVDVDVDITCYHSTSTQSSTRIVRPAAHEEQPMATNAVPFDVKDVQIGRGLITREGRTREFDRIFDRFRQLF